MYMLKLIDIQTFYGNIQVLKDLCIAVSPGEIITLIGANGAGKTTTLMSITGIVPPRAGQILFLNKPIHDMNPDEIVALGISLVP
jgi:branched-chain amino acid transport system ATP-binding protein